MERNHYADITVIENLPTITFSVGRSAGLSCLAVLTQPLQPTNPALPGDAVRSRDLGTE